VKCSRCHGARFDPEQIGPCGACCGRGVVCPRCKRPRLDTKRGYWHPACVEEHLLATDQAHFRRRVEERDHGVCALCHLDTAALDQELRALRAHQETFEQARWGSPEAVQRRAFQNRVHGLLLTGWDRDALENGPLWEADHIVPRAEGGDDLGLDNRRTLCVPCHKTESAKLLARLADKRAKAKGYEGARSWTRSIPSRPFPKRPDSR